ncbi:MAG TPA: sugar porter family MFS transporter [Prolixibacteraceae bacterium]|nr:sugar porter family MFS transporter [Prolixibacteraceae bacterium]
MDNKRLYTWWLAIVASLGGFLFGYDTAVISGTLSMVREQFALNVGMEGWYVSSALVGCIAGVAVAGWLSDRYGRKKVLLLAAAMFTISAIGCAFVGSFASLVVYRLIGGMGVGIASMLAPMYISEIAHPSLRGRMVAVYQLAITIGILGAFFVNAWLLGQSDATAAGSAPLTLIFKSEVWRAMLGMESVPAFTFFILILMVPESPRWLVVQGRTAKARQILLKTAGETNAEQEIREIKESFEMNTGSIKIMRHPGIKAAIFLGVSLAVLAQFTGIDAIIYYGPRILEQAGFTLSDALNGQVIIGIINMSFTLLAIWKIDSLGRKPLLIAGTLGMFVALTAIGLLFLIGKADGILLLSFILIFIASFAFSLGPVVWVILSEIYPTKIRGRAMSIATMATWIATSIIGQVIPFLLDNLGPAFTFWLFAFFCIPTVLIGWKLMPETKGRTLENIEKYWYNYKLLKK